MRIHKFLVLLTILLLTLLGNFPIHGAGYKSWNPCPPKNCYCNYEARIGEVVTHTTTDGKTYSCVCPKPKIPAAGEAYTFPFWKCQLIETPIAPKKELVKKESLKKEKGKKKPEELVKKQSFKKEQAKKKCLNWPFGPKKPAGC